MSCPTKLLFSAQWVCSGFAVDSTDKAIRNSNYTEDIKTL